MMTRIVTSMSVIAIAMALMPNGGVAVALAQGRQQKPQSPPPTGSPLDQPGVTPAEIQRMFEAVALVRAQDVLKLSDDKYLLFLTKFKALQDVRRRTQQERNRLVNELRRLTNDPASDDAQMKDRLKALQDLDARSEAELHKTYEAVDLVLDVRQQAKFRVFEENMERQRIDLLMKARANRQLNRKQQ